MTEEGPIGKISNLYDEKGRLTAREVKFHDHKEAFLTEYSYDNFDRVVKVTSPSGEFNYTYDREGRIASQSVGDKLVVNEYDPSGRLVSKTFGDTVLAKYEYDAMNRRVAGQYFDVKWDYSYDQYNQLTGAKNSEGQTYQYTYDSIGNRLKAIENGTERSFSYNKLNQISNSGYAYDAWGNMTKTPEAEYAYDLKNRLIKVTKSDGTVIEYTYDAMDQRIGSKVADKETSFLMSGMIEYARNDGEVQYHTLGLDIANRLKYTSAVGAILTSGDSSYLYDGNGNVIAAIKDDIIVSKLTYSPFGKQYSGDVLNFSFSSKSIDLSELSYYGFRFYVPMTGRWEKPDPIRERGGLNLYTFANNNAINHIDFFGLRDVFGSPGGVDSRAFTGDPSCGKCCLVGVNKYCLDADVNGFYVNVGVVELDRTVYGSNIRQVLLSGVVYNCTDTYKLKPGTSVYEKVKRHEELHQQMHRKMHDDLKNLALSVDGNDYENEQDCNTAVTQLIRDANAIIAESTEDGAGHIGSHWNGLRPIDSDYAYIYYTKQESDFCWNASGTPPAFFPEQ